MLIDLITIKFGYFSKISSLIKVYLILSSAKSIKLLFLSAGSFILEDNFNIPITLWVDFEYIKLPIPKGYDEVLKDQYGEYMTPIKCPTLHGYVVFDCDKDYRDTIADLKKKQPSIIKRMLCR